MKRSILLLLMCLYSSSVFAADAAKVNGNLLVDGISFSSGGLPMTSPPLDGKSVRSGIADPVAQVGVEGDFYINTSTNRLFGPKVGSEWGNGVSLVGPKGDKGDAGECSLTNICSSISTKNLLLPPYCLTGISLEKISSDPAPQYALVAFPNKFIVKVKDQNGYPVSNQIVAWTADTNGWTIPNNGQTISDKDGLASISWVNGTASNTKLTATIGNSSIYFSGSTKPWAIRPDGLAATFIEYSPEAINVDGLSRDITPLTEPDGTYYAVLNWDGGYAGIQKKGSQVDRQIQFSVWNINGVPDSTRLINAGTSNCTNFSHEGTGIGCVNSYPWKIGDSYRFQMFKSKISSSSYNLSAYLTDLQSNTVLFLGTIQQDNTPPTQYIASFVEDFILNDSDCTTVKKRSAIFGNSKYYLNGVWNDFPHNGVYLPWDPTSHCAIQNYEITPTGIQITVGNGAKASTLSTYFTLPIY